MADTNALTFKFLLVGDGGVGKTSLVHSLRDQTFDTSVESTVGVEFSILPVTIDDTNINLHIWDTAGQEVYRALSRSYYRDAIGVLLLFAFNDHQSFDSLEEWMSNIKSLCHPKARVILVGNKTDLAESRAVTRPEIDRFASANGITFIETSAKASTNVREAFYKLAQDVLNGIKSNEIRLEQQTGEPVPTKKEDKKCCN